jgi:RNA polymerase subunit RPABC4/transcription elongation factor Spt4
MMINKERILAGLMYSCKNLGEVECHPEVSKWGREKKSEGGKDLSIQTKGEVLKKLDEICRRCETRFFETDERKCPVCGEEEAFLEIKGFEIFNENEKKFENFYLRCNKCETPLALRKAF